MIKETKYIGRPNSFGIVAQAVRRSFHIELARYLKKEYQAKIILYVSSESSISYYEKNGTDAFDEIVVIDKVSDWKAWPKERASDPEILVKAEYYEQRYGVPLGWFMTTDRVHGLGYSPGGFYFPRSGHNDYANYLDVIASYVRIFDFWEKEISQKKFEVLLDGFHFEYFPAMANNLPMRTALSSRNENYYFWSHNCYGELQGLEQTFQSMPEVAVDFKSLDQAPVLNKKQLDQMAKRNSIFLMLKRMCKIIYGWAYRKYKGDKSKQYKLYWELRFVFQEWYMLNKFYGANLANLNDIKNKKYIFYALQVEPELNFQGYSPEYFYQLAAIISLSRDLPADTYLVVKEHIPAVSRRPKQFYDQIRLLKNVIFADPRVPGLSIVKHAKAVVTINGTIGQEAAVLGIPVISLGKRNLYNILEHVHYISTESDLAPLLRKILNVETSQNEYRKCGDRYLRALQLLSFSMGDFGYHNPEGHSPKVICDSVSALLKSLDAKDVINETAA